MKMHGMLILSLIPLLLAFPISFAAEPLSDTEYNRRLDAAVKDMNEGHATSAAVALQALVDAEPNKPLAHYNLGLLRYKLGDYTGAIRSFSRVTELHSPLSAQALYYTAIAQNNLGQREAALKTAKRIPKSRNFYQPTQQLIRGLEKNHDDYLDLARNAFAGKDFQLCIASLQASIFSDTPEGKALELQCRQAAAPKTEEGVTSAGAPATEPRNYRLYANSRVGASDNISQASSNPASRPSLYLSGGGEYTWRDTVDFGVGASYEYYDALSFSGLRSETVNVYVPLSYVKGPHQLSPYAYYALNMSNGDKAFYDVGLTLGYYYSLRDYLFGVTNTLSSRNNLSASTAYQTGQYDALRFTALRFFERLAFGAGFGFEWNGSGDIPMGTSVLPQRNNAISYNASASYGFTAGTKLTARAAFTHYNFSNRYTSIDRRDFNKNFSLTLLHSFSPNISAYLQQTHTNNKSSYTAAQLIDKNYVENATVLGISITTY